MNAIDNRLSRRRFLQARPPSAPPSRLGASRPPATSSGQQGGTFNWMTWSDHYIDDQLKAIETSDKITANISELAGNAEGFAKLKEVKGQLDMISGDALWVPSLLRGRAHRAVRHQRAEGLLAALPVRARVRHLDDARGLPRATRSAGRRSASTTTRRVRRSGAGLVGGTARSQVQGPGRRREPARGDRRLHGQGVGRRRRLQHDRRPAGHGQGAPRAAQAERPEVRPAGDRQRRRDGQRRGVARSPATSATRTGSRRPADPRSRASSRRRAPSAGWTPR